MKVQYLHPYILVTNDSIKGGYNVYDDICRNRYHVSIWWFNPKKVAGFSNGSFGSGPEIQTEISGSSPEISGSSKIFAKSRNQPTLIRSSIQLEIMSKISGVRKFPDALRRFPDHEARRLLSPITFQH